MDYFELFSSTSKVPMFLIKKLITDIINANPIIRVGVAWSSGQHNNNNNNNKFITQIS